jgi:hypothetical protein
MNRTWMLLPLVTSLAAGMMDVDRGAVDARVAGLDRASAECTRPPADSDSAALDAYVDALLPRVAPLLGVSTPPAQAVERIGRDLPNVRAVEVLRYRMCVAHGNGTIDAAAYDWFVSLILPLLRETITQNFFDARNRAEGYAMGTIVGMLASYNMNNGGYPASLVELRVQEQVAVLDATRLEYKLDSTRGFALRFAGSDRILNTSDDPVLYGS